MKEIKELISVALSPALMRKDLSWIVLMPATLLNICACIAQTILRLSRIFCGSCYDHAKMPTLSTKICERSLKTSVRICKIPKDLRGFEMVVLKIVVRLHMILVQIIKISKNLFKTITWEGPAQQ